MSKRALLIFLLSLLFIFILDRLFSNPSFFSPYALQIIVLMGINAILAISWDLVAGITGQFSIGQAGFMAIGAYSAAYLTLKYHIPFFIAILFSAFLSTLAGFIVGIPSLRLKGDYLAIATLGFGEIVRVAILNMDCLGGARGMKGIPILSSFFSVYLVLAISLWLCLSLLKSQVGRILLSIREDELASQMMGVDIVKHKVFAFAFSACLAGVGGALYAHWTSFIHPDSFTFMKSIEIILMGVIGGMGTIYGAAIGGAIVSLLPEGLRLLLEQNPLLYESKEFIRMLFFAFLLLFFIILRPQGLFGKRE
ncbi:MAG: branched-chain amino acid ABC transporter permease [bacterium]